MMLEGWISVAVLVVLVWFAITIYNRLVGLRNRADASWSDVDVQLKRRTDLIPNLVEAVNWALNLRMLSEIRRDYDTTFPAIRDEVYRTMVERRLFPASPHGVRRAWAIVGVPGIAAGIAAFTMELPWVAAPPMLLAIGLAVSGIVVLACSRAMPRRTWRGARLLAHVQGFQEFLERAERDRLERLPPDTLHRWMPWAMALGVTERWILAFEGLKVDEPSWYTGDRPFTLTTYDRALATFGRRIEDAILTTRRSPAGFGITTSSSDSGFSSGSQGRGFGGGGGGTFYFVEPSRVAGRVPSRPNPR